jgi:hypothetical protein
MAREAVDMTPEEIAALNEKEPSALQLHLVEWIKEKTGVTFATKKEEMAWEAGVIASVKFRMRHQASSENQARLEAARAAAEEEEAPATPAPAKKVAPAKVVPAKKGSGKKSAAAAAPVEEAAPVKSKSRPKPKATSGEAPF